MKKRIFVVLFLVTFLFTACGQSSGSPKDDSTKAETQKETEVITESQTQSETQAPEPKDDGIIDLTIEKGSLKYVKHELTEDYEGTPAICIYFDYTNLSDDAQMCMTSFSVKPFQNGIECELAILSNGPEEDGNSVKEVKKGVTLPVCYSFKLQDTTSDIELEVSDLFDFSGGDPDTQILTLQ